MAEYNPETPAQKICELCFENNSKYCCPRCSILFCSLDCYKAEKHADCSEGFYRDLVHKEMISYHADDDGSRYKMTQILKRLIAQGAGGDVGGTEGTDDDSDDEEVIDLYERIKGLDLENADEVWSSLTTDERFEFEAMINHGEIGHLMPDWKPWWEFRTEKRLVKNINKEMEEARNWHRCPEHKCVPEMSELTTVEPSKAIRYNITNVIASYAFTVRYFCGEVDPVEWTIYFLNICDNLDKNTNFDEPALAVESVVQNCLQSQLIQTDKQSLDVMRYDTFLILQGPNTEDPKYFCKSALSHVHRILARARVTAKKQQNIAKPDSVNAKTDSVNAKTDSVNAKPESVNAKTDSVNAKPDTADAKPDTGNAERKSRKTKKSNKEKPFSQRFPEHNVKNMIKLDIEQLKKCLKKVEYYLSYVESYDMYYELDEE